jgi:hypothetical protein
MSRENLCDKVNDGDIIFFGEERLQVFKANKKSKVQRLAVVSDGPSVYGLDAFQFRNETRDFAEANPGDRFKYRSSGWSGVFHGFVTTARRSVKTVPVLFSGGELSVDKYRDMHLFCFLDGDLEAYKKLPRYGREIDMEFAVVVPAQVTLPKLADVKGFTKRDLIAYVVHVNGEGKLSRDPIMKKVAALEGKPWIPTSNTDYFMGVEAKADAKGTLRKAAKGKYGRILYGLGANGRERAAKVLARLGEEPGRI